MIGSLQATTPTWIFEQINFVVGLHRSVTESDSYIKLKKLDVQEGKKDRLFADHMTQICEVHDQVILSVLQQMQVLTRPKTDKNRFFKNFS